MSQKKDKKNRRTRSAMDADLLALMRLVDSNLYDKVEFAAQKILDKRPGNHLAIKALTFSLIGQSRFDEALPILDFALAKWPQDPELHNNRGIALSSTMRWDESIESFNTSLSIQPDDPDVLKNLGLAYGRMHQWERAVGPLLKAIECYPGDYLDAVVALASALTNCNRLDEAWLCYKELWESERDVGYLFDMISTGLHRCDWDGLTERLSDLRKLSDDYSKYIGVPFMALACPEISALEQHKIAASYVEYFVPRYAMEQAPIRSTGSSYPGRRLRLAYLSADFRLHPVGFVFPRVLELHDRSAFEVIGYSLGADDGSDIRSRLASAFDEFVDVSALSVHSLAERIKADKIDILVDLNGWTRDGRPELMATRCAPIQVNWLGYAGTMGHPRLADYLVGDPVVTPLEDQAAFSEALALMPHCYLPVDTRVSCDRVMLRAEQGLPDEGFVFCSFNVGAKYNPDVFDLWCKILRDTPGSCLWLSRPAGSAADRLISEALARGVSKERLIFATRMNAREDHLSRLRLADLALDPFPYNSHSTGLDVLWAGVPMVSCLGKTFPSRVGASLLRSANLGELVVNSTEEYHALVVSLYRDRERLSNLRKRLSTERDRLPLFDMSGFVASLERLYLEMEKNRSLGIRPPIDGRLLLQ